MIKPLARHPLPLGGKEVPRTVLRPPGIKGVIFVELLLLGLAGLGGLALLLQQKPLPSRAEAEEAFDKLEKNPLDPDANTVMGKYKAFVMGDYDGAMPYLVNSKDATLKTLAEHELDAGYTALPAQKMTMGDEWVAAAKKFPALSRIFYDRAAQWYINGWEKLEGKDKERARLQGRRVAASRPPGAARKGVPEDWLDEAGPGGRPVALDGTVARTGSYSIKMSAPDEKIKNSYSGLVSNLILVPPGTKNYELSAYILSDGTESASDQIAVRFFGANGALVVNPISSYYPIDVPFWNRASQKGKVPEGTVRSQVVFLRMSKKGSMWVDDVSLKFDGKEALKNGSFDEK